MRKRIIISTLVLLGVLAFIRFGRIIYVPLKQKLFGKATLESVSTKLYPDVLARLKPNLEKIGLTNFPSEILIVGLKEERQLEIYAKTEAGFELLKSYPFKAMSGQLGPKLKEGDDQIPEGIYKIEYLNPNSLYHLSMKINYPNTFDLSKTTLENKKDLGNDICIHGKEVTIGCIPIGDGAIEEVFILTHNAINKGVKVILSPRDFRKNATTPEITAIEWETELYDTIKQELNAIQ